jgi:hypothetical protein
VNPTSAVVFPTVVGMFTVQLVVKLFNVLASVIVSVSVVPL